MALGPEGNKTAVFLHGIMGNKKNWQGFVRLFLESFPSWNALIFDLRNHGESSKHATPFSVSAAAADIAQALELLNLEASALIGHSFGGKVAALAAGKIPSIRQLWLLDSSFSSVEQFNSLEKYPSMNALEVLEVLDQIHWPVQSRRTLIDELQALGVSNQIALWMTTNLEPVGEALKLNFNPSELKKMLMDFLSLDLWDQVSTLSRTMDIHLVAASHGFRLSSVDEVRLQELALSRGFFHVLKDSGHFVQADNPSGLIELMRPYFKAL